MIPTPHISLKDKSLIAKTVLMPGDPLRAKMIAETFLTDIVMINEVRNMFGYTGKYKGVPVTVMGGDAFNWYLLIRIIPILWC